MKAESVAPHASPQAAISAADDSLDPVAGAMAGPLTGRSPTRRDRMMATIRAAAITEFSLHGLRGASTQAIAERAGLTKPQLHYYIKGKENLYEELLGSVVMHWSEDTTFDHASDDPRAVLTRYIAEKSLHAMNNPELSRIFGMEVLGGAPNLTRYWPTALAVTRRMVATIDRWIAQGRMRPLNAHLLLMNIWAMTSHYTYYAVQVRRMAQDAPEKPMDRNAIVQEITCLVLLGCGLRVEED